MADTEYRVYDTKGTEVGRVKTRCSAATHSILGGSVRKYVDGKKKQVWTVVRRPGESCNRLETA